MNEDCKPIYQWLEKGGKIIYSSGGRFSDEIGADARRKLNELAKKGNAILIGARIFQNAEAAVKRDGSCKSDDFHVLALAKISGARVLYTRDRNLIEDFKNKAVIDDPRGRVYSGKANKNLLGPSTCRRK